MKLYNIWKFLLVFVAVSIISACSDSFLDIKPAGGIGSEGYPSTDDEAFSVMVGGYNLMQWNYGRDWSSAFFVKNLPADDLNAGSSESDQPPYQNLDKFVNEADNSATTGIWEGFYKTINHCNTVLARLEGTNALRKQILAEAKAMRAWNYFELVVMFGDVPLYTVNPAQEEEFHKPRSPKSEVYAQIETDLKDAIAALPLKSELSASHKFRISKGTAQSILGKVYLYQKKWDEAHTVLSEVISSGEYDLVPVEQVWRKEQELGKESVFEILYTGQEGYDWGNFPWDGAMESNVHVLLMGPREPFFSNLGTIGIFAGWGFNLPTKKIGDAFAAMGDNGPRYKSSLMSEAEFIAAGGTIVSDKDDDGNTVPAHDYEGYLRLKYATYISEANTSGAAEAILNFTTNWRLIRYADVLLMAAEAYNEDSKPDLAVIELNKVRVRAELPATTASSQADVREAIVKERQLELAFEGSRFWDLVRWGKAAEELSSLGFQANKHELFPIPQSEIASNNAITQADQNPGH